jgi:hypothetical protein
MRSIILEVYESEGCAVVLESSGGFMIGIMYVYTDNDLRHGVCI